MATKKPKKQIKPSKRGLAATKAAEEKAAKARAERGRRLDKMTQQEMAEEYQRKYLNKSKK